MQIAKNKVALFLVLVGMLILSGCAKKQHYTDIETTNEEATRIYKEVLSKDKETLQIVLFKPSCPYCKQAEKTIVNTISADREANRVVLDISKEYPDWLTEIDGVVENSMIKVPKIINVKSDSGHMKLISKYLGSDKGEIKKTLEK